MLREGKGKVESGKAPGGREPCSPQQGVWIVFHGMHLCFLTSGWTSRLETPASPPFWARGGLLRSTGPASSPEGRSRGSLPICFCLTSPFATVLCHENKANTGKEHSLRMGLSNSEGPQMRFGPWLGHRTGARTHANRCAHQVSHVRTKRRDGTYLVRQSGGWLGWSCHVLSRAPHSSPLCREQCYFLLQQVRLLELVHYLTDTLRQLFFATGKNSLWKWKKLRGKKKGIRLLKWSEGDTQAGKHMNKHGTLPWHSLDAELGTFSSIYLSNPKVNHKRKKRGREKFFLHTQAKHRRVMLPFILGDSN